MPLRTPTVLALLLALAACGPDDPSPSPSPEPAPTATPAYVDVTEEAGITFVHTNGAYGKMYFPETMGGGCAFLDYDGDEDQDILLVNSTFWRPWQFEKAGFRPTSALYQNDGSGRFRDVTQEAGLDVEFYGLGVAIGDYDGDGDPDVVLTGIGGNRVLRNDDGRYVDVTAESGLAGHEDDYNTSAGFFDADGDGDLDLFICNYVEWSKRIDDRRAYKQEPIGRMYGPPTIWGGRNCYLYRNEGNGRFVDVSKAAGIHVESQPGKPVGKALGVVFMDLERDGDLDVFVGNDTVRNFLFVNRGDGTFEEMAQRVGVAREPNGNETGAMGVDVADLYDDDRLIIGVGNYEASSLYTPGASPLAFIDRATPQGLGVTTRSMITFGFFFYDQDLDGYLDLFQANGGLDYEGHRLTPPVPYLQPNQLFRNVEGKNGRTYELLSAEAAGAIADPCVGRGAAYADMDGDGDLDILVGEIGRAPTLLRNEYAGGHHWLRVRLEGAGMNREAIGAWISLTAGGRTQRRQVMPTRSYCSSVELPVTFGLGTHGTIERLAIEWPDGTKQDVPPPTVDQTIVVRRSR